MNTQTKHTPGPWMLNLGNLCEIDTKSHAIAHIYGTASCETHVARECRANARLISAAPELLAALVELCADRYLSDPINADRMANARAAIAKATGQA
jgi:hypothetical protein